MKGRNRSGHPEPFDGLTMSSLFSFFFLFLFSLPLHADEPLRMIFFQPGGEGTPEEAQPFLDALSAQISEKGGPAIKGTYVQDKATGEAALRSGRFTIGIVPLDFYLLHSTKPAMEILLATLPEATGAPRDRFTLLIIRGKKMPALFPVTLSRPADEKFVRKILLKDWPQRDKAPITVAEPGLLAVLKKIAEGSLTAGALVDSFELRSLKALSSPWAKELEEVHTSPETPSPPVVLLKPLDETTKTNLKRAMIGLGSSEEGKEILSDLRLSGFADPPLDEYKKWVDHLSNAARAAPKTPAESPN